MDQLSELRQMMLEYGSGPLFNEMPRNNLVDKGIAGPTAAHRIEEIHTPLNLAYVTFTTGSSAFQNPVGVTHQELPARIAAGKLALERCGVRPGDAVVVTYPPLVNVFSHDALTQYGVEVRFIQRPSRDALLVELCSGARCIIGESSFLRSALQDAHRLGLLAYFPKDLIFIAAGTPLDPALPEETARLTGATVHDLYGCQEFGWLTLDGVPLRGDVLCGPEDENGLYPLIVGGIPTGDWFRPGRHMLNGQGMICTHSRVRAPAELETTLLSGIPASRDTALRTARTILRIKAKIVRVAPDYQCSEKETAAYISTPSGLLLMRVTGPDKTRMLDDLTQAQMAYQREAKTDPIWNKRT